MPPRTAESILDLVGQTPLLRLGALEPAGGAEVWAKLEYLNPGGSVKDRAALGLIRAGERLGRLRPGGTIVEPTAGNTGIGLALIGRRLGYRVILCVPANFSREKMVLMQALGGELVVTPEELGMRGAIDRAHALAASLEGAWVPQQFENQANPDYHDETTAAELWDQTGGRVDALVMGAGTGGTFTGIVRHFRNRGAAVRAVLVEPQGSIWGGGAPGPHQVEGIGNSFWPATLHRDLVDEVLMVRDGPAFAMALALARECGVIAGGSGGAAVAAAVQVAARCTPLQRVVTLVPDAAERYMSKGMYGELR
ncbi:MAG: cysteine synthase family protein [Vicinamibacterales bacterium]|nr:cysteine synthase family protein [Vicinamibacterales bacterium]